MMSKYRRLGLIFILFAIPLWGMLSVSAQTDINQPRPPDRTPRPTQERNVNNPPQNTPQARPTRDFSSYFDNLTAVVPSVTFTALPTVDLTMPAEMPAWDEIDFSQLPITLTWENPLETSQEAYSALVGFDNTYLGSGQSPTYAGMYSSTDGNADAYNAIVAQLPADIQTYVTMLGGSNAVTYWGTYPAGLGMVVVADCNLTQCTQNYESLQIQISQGAMGIYGEYQTTLPTSEQEALSQIISTYPLLGSATFYPYQTDSGYAFSAVSQAITRSNASIVGYYVGVIPLGNTAFVYAVVGVGDGTVAVMFP